MHAGFLGRVILLISLTIILSAAEDTKQPANPTPQQSASSASQAEQNGASNNSPNTATPSSTESVQNTGQSADEKTNSGQASTEDKAASTEAPSAGANPQPKPSQPTPEDVAQKVKQVKQAKHPRVWKQAILQKQAQEKILRERQQEEQRIAKEEQEELQWQHDAQVQSMSRTQIRKEEERKEYSEESERANKDTQFNSYMFECAGQYDLVQFELQLPVDQEVAIALKSYIVSGNTYVPVSVLHSEIPVHLDISNGENSILRADFYFQKFVLFKGQKGIKYSIRFLNGGTAKLILMDFKVLTETVHVKDALTPQDIVSHSSRATELYHDITLLINGFKRIWMLEYNSITKISGDIRNYSYYSIAQLAMVLFVSILQIVVIKRMLSSHILA